ncbi:MAG: TolC family protein [Desulfobacterales bacterium]|nr:TolC family protein [Desulfobacterales bacterium]
MKHPQAGGKKWLLAAALTLLLLTGHSGAAWPAEMIWAPPVLEQLIDEALENNQSLRSRAAQVKALESRAHAAGTLPDPKLGFAVQSLPTDSFAFDQEPMTQKQIFLEQTVPWLSKLDLRSETAAYNAREEEARLEAARLELARDVADAWYELGYVAESQRINDELVELLERIRRDAESGYAVGEGLQQDIFQAEVEHSRLEDEAVRLESRRSTIEDRLHELANRQDRESIDPPSALPEPDFSFSAVSLAKSALARNPDLKELQAAIEGTAAETRLAEKDYFPDFNIRLTYGQREEDRTGRDLPDFFSAAVAMDIPLWHKSKQSSEVAAAIENERSARNRYHDLKTRLPYRISSLAAEIKDSRRRYALYEKELIPQAGQWARSALEAYEVDRVEFDTMIEARIRVLKYRREASRLFYNIYQKRAELEAWIGGALQTGQQKTFHESRGQSHDDQ